MTRDLCSCCFMPLGTEFHRDVEGCPRCRVEEQRAAALRREAKTRAT